MPTEQQLRNVVSEQEIRRLLGVYCRGIDRCDAELVASVYHDDAWDDHGDGYRGPAADFVEFVIPRLRGERATTHALHHSLIEFDDAGTSAAVETYCVSTHVTGPDEAIVLDHHGLRYIDRWEDRPGAGWRIFTRVVVMEWHHRTGGTALDSIGKGRKYILPQRDRDDLAYVAELPRRDRAIATS